MTPQLAAAYRATTYRVRLGGTQVDLRIDRRHPELDRWLGECGVTTWAWLSAANPGSQRFADADNRRRHGELLAQLEAQGWRVAVGESIADAGDWPPEISVLVAGIGAAAAAALARAWRQNALLAGEVGGPARLLEVASVSG